MGAEKIEEPVSQEQPLPVPDLSDGSAAAGGGGGEGGGAPSAGGGMSPAAEDAAVNSLMDAEIDDRIMQLTSEDQAARDEARETLAAMGDKAVGKLQATMVAHPDPAMRGAAVDLVASLGENGKAAIPTLKEALNDPDPEVRAKANDALNRLDGSPSP